MNKVILGMIAVCVLYCGQALSVMNPQQAVELYGRWDCALMIAIFQNDRNLAHGIIEAARLENINPIKISEPYCIELAVSLNGTADSHLDIIEYLVSRGFGPCRKDANGSSLLDSASPAAKRCVKMIALSANE